MMNASAKSGVVVAMIWLLVGCGYGSQEAGPSSDQEYGQRTAGDFEWSNEVMALKLSGRDSEAMSLLLDGSAPSNKIEIPELLTWSEEDFTSQPREALEASMQTTPKMLGDISALVRNARTTVLNTSDAEKKQARAQRLKRFGEDLSREDRLAVLQIVGNAIDGWEL